MADCVLVPGPGTLGAILTLDTIADTDNSLCLSQVQHITCSIIIYGLSDILEDRRGRLAVVRTEDVEDISNHPINFPLSLTSVVMHGVITETENTGLCCRLQPPGSALPAGKSPPSVTSSPNWSPASNMSSRFALCYTLPYPTTIVNAAGRYRPVQPERGAAGSLHC